MARLRATAKGGPFLLKTEMVAGHGGRSGRYDAWEEEALFLASIVETALRANERPASGQTRRANVSRPPKTTQAEPEPGAASLVGTDRVFGTSLAVSLHERPADP